MDSRDEQNHQAQKKNYGQRKNFANKKRKAFNRGQIRQQEYGQRRGAEQPLQEQKMFHLATRTQSKWLGSRITSVRNFIDEHYCAGFARELAHRHKCWFNNGQPFNSVGSQVLGPALPAPSFLHAMH